MPNLIRAIYENGILRPLEPLNLLEHESVSVAIERDSGRPVIQGTAVSQSEEDWLDKDAIAYARLFADPSVTLEDARNALSNIKGSLSDAISEQRGGHT